MKKDERMHAATAMDIHRRLEKALAVLDKDNTPEEFKKAIKELRSLAADTKITYAKKPIPKKAWDNVWSNLIGDFIESFEHNIVNDELTDEDKQELYLKGIAKGMWTVYNIIEELMVSEK